MKKRIEHLYRNDLPTDQWTACGIETDMEYAAERNSLTSNNIRYVNCEKCIQSDIYKNIIANKMAQKLLK
jgi:hypothetical protein